jgi:hypothetical protein
MRLNYCWSVFLGNRRGRLTLPAHWLAVLVFTLVAMLPFTWTRGNEILLYGDGIFPGHVDFNTYRFAWAERFYGANPGRYVFTGFIDIPAYFLNTALQATGLSQGAVQRLILSGSLFLSGFLTYLTALFLLRVGRLAAVFTGLLYAINLHALLYVWMPQLPLYYFWAITPATLALCVKMLQNQSGWRYFFLFQMALLVQTLGFSNPAFIAMVWGVLLSISLYLVISRQREFRIVFIRMFAAVAIWCCLNAWWILPNIFGLENMLDTRYSFENSMSSITMIQNATKYASLLNSWRMLGSNLLYYPQTSWWSNIYHSQPALVCIGFLYPTLCVVGVLMGRRSKMVPYFALMWLLFLFLAKGIHPPLGQFMAWGYERIPGFLAFRNSLEKFGHFTIMSGCLLAGYGVNAICNRIRSHLHRYVFIVAMAVLIIGVYAWPAWTGAIVGRSTSIYSHPITFAVEIPSSYNIAAQTIMQDKNDSFVMVLPQGDGGPFPNWYTHSWGYQGVDIFTHVIDKPSLVPIYLSLDEGQPVNVAGYVYKAILSSSHSLDLFLGMLNIGYVVVHNDLNPLYHKTEPSFLLNKILGEQQNLILVGDFGELSVYRIGQVLPPIYATQDVVTVVGDISALSSLVSLDSYNLKQSFLFSYTRPISYGVEEGGSSTQTLMDRSSRVIVVPVQDKKSSSERGLVFNVEVPRDAAYEILLNKNCALNDLEIDNSSVRINHQQLAYTDASEWHSVIDIYLIQGVHKFEISQKQFCNSPIPFLLRWQNSSTLPNPVIRFAKQNPTRYTVRIESIKQPFLLTFLQTYHPGWTINGYCGPEKGRVKAQHLLVNGYANGWWIENLGDCELTLEFLPQRLLLIGGFISISTFLLLLLCIVPRKYIILRIVKKRR